MAKPTSESELRRQISIDASLGTLTHRLAVTPRALRYYEQRGLIAVARDRLNRRRYDAATQRQIEMIVRLRRCGLGVRAIAEALAAHCHGEATSAVLVARLSALLDDLDYRRNAIEAEIKELRRSHRPALVSQVRSSIG